MRLHTDVPKERLAPGAVLFCEPVIPPTLTVVGARNHGGRWLVSFAGIGDRDGADALRGLRLFAEASPEAGVAQADAWYETDLVGLRVYDPAGVVLGTVVGLQLRPAQDLLEVRLDDGRRGLVPFVAALVPVVDVPAGRVVIDVPDGLFDLDA